jgi:hypothetical protein
LDLNRNSELEDIEKEFNSSVSFSNKKNHIFKNPENIYFSDQVSQRKRNEDSHNLIIPELLEKNEFNLFDTELNTLNFKRNKYNTFKPIKNSKIKIKIKIKIKNKIYFFYYFYSFYSFYFLNLVQRKKISISEMDVYSKNPNNKVQNNISKL